MLITNGFYQIQGSKALATSNIEFVSNASDEQVTEFLSKTKALIFPGEEDFGIVPLEAQACGKPVIAFGKGGALETVIGLNHNQSDEPNATGIFFYEQNPQSLLKAVRFFEEHREWFKARKCRDNSIKFGRSVYKQSMRRYIQNATDKLS